MAQSPGEVIKYHVSRIPYYFISFFDWLFTVITMVMVMIIA